MIATRHEWMLSRMAGMVAIPMPRQRTGKGYGGKFPITWGAQPRVTDRSVEEWGAKLPALLSIKTKEPGLVSGIIDISAPEDVQVRQGLLARVLADEGYVCRKVELSRACGERLLAFTAGMTPERMAGATNAELVRVLQGFRERYTDFEWHAAVWFVGGDDLAAEAERRLRARARERLAEVMQAMFSPTEESFAHAEQVGMLRLALTAEEAGMRAGTEEEMARLLERAPALREALERHTAAYFWIPFGHAGPDLWDVRHFVAELHALVDEGNVREKLSAALEYHKKLSEKQERFAKEFAITGTLARLCTDLRMLASLQDARKEIICRSHIPWQTAFLPEVARRLQVPVRLLCDVTAEELQDALEGKVLDVQELGKRLGNAILVVDETGCTYYVGEDYEAVARIMREKATGRRGVVQGIPASPGRARGIAKVMKSAEEMDKVRDGDVLITTMTTPDYVPAMRRAAAIVTNEGGVTCHAAIISREFGIPCVIGTQDATFAFVDGDLVEVDADRGTVRKVPGRVVRLDGLFPEDGERVGGKAAALGALAGAFPVPRGVVVTVDAFAECVPDVSERLARAASDQEVRQASQEIGEAIRGSGLPEDVAKDIREASEGLRFPVAVRSSATAEDLPHASFAGQHESFLNVPREGLLAAVQECWASLYSPRAIAYRRAKGIAGKVAMAVIVQEMVDAEKAGVLFTAHPVTGDRREMLIEAVQGLGEALVSGKVIPSRYVVAEGVVQERDGSILSDQEVLAITTLGKRVEESRGCPQDIEWALDRAGKLWLLQARPITTL